jgi:hypothetical protein
MSGGNPILEEGPSLSQMNIQIWQFFKQFKLRQQRLTTQACQSNFESGEE